jgi:hypothetical protein
MRRVASWIAGAVLAYATLTALGAIDASAGGARIGHPADMAGAVHADHAQNDAARLTTR